MKTVLVISTTILAYVIPLILVIIWRIKTKCSFKPFLIGALGFVIFANVFESLFHYFMLYGNQTTANFINNNPLVYGIYGALTAGIFEEVGRLFCYKVFLRKNKEKENSVAYGIGHGGIECIFVLGSTYLIYSIVALGGNLGDPQTTSEIALILNGIDPIIIPIALIERILALTIQIGLSIIVFKAASNKKCFYYFPLAIILHTLTDLPAGLYQAGIIKSIAAIEIITAIFAIAIIYYGVAIYKTIGENESEEVI